MQSPSTSGFLSRILFLAAALLLLTGTAWAEAERKYLTLSVGGSEIVEIDQPSLNMKILASDGEVVYPRPLSERRLMLRGQKLGHSTVTIVDNQQVKAYIDVTVTRDLTPLKAQFMKIFPKENIEVYSHENGIILSGTVSGPEVMDKVLRLAQSFVAERYVDNNTRSNYPDPSVTGRSGAGVVNLLQIAGGQQVMLEVKFAEVTRDKSRDWQAALGLINQGKDLLVGAGTKQLLGSFITGYSNDGTPKFDVLPVSASGGGIPDPGFNPGSMLLNFAGNAANIFVKIDNLTMALQFLESEGLARTLAEPRLVTLSGQEASFLAGGEFPYPVPDDNGNPGIEFKEFGVGLRFTPVVMADGRISLKVAPSVSEITGTTFIPTSFTDAVFPIPNLSTRKLETTVHLKDGQTLALAGLLQDNLRETTSKIPGLGDLPILGALFRSSGYIQRKTDLLVAVTPHLVNPVPEGTLQFPGEKFQPPNPFEFYLLGRLEGVPTPGEPSAVGKHTFPQASAAPGSGGLEGAVGFQSTTN